MSEDKENTPQDERQEAQLVHALKIGKACKKLNIEDPVTLYNNIKAKYGEHTPDIVRNCLVKPIDIMEAPVTMGSPARADDLLNYFSQTPVYKVDAKKLGRASGDENWAILTVNQAIQNMMNGRDDFGK